jgi:Tfp pilus assembly protein PilN
MTKRPITVYGCSTDQKNECDYKYLARVWFFRTVAIFVSTAFVSVAFAVWSTAEWKTINDKDIIFLKEENSKNSARITKVESIKSDIDSVKAWIRPKE